MIEITTYSGNDKYTEEIMLLRAIWKASGYTTKEISEITGYPYQTVKSWIQGRRNVPMSKVIDIRDKIEKYEITKKSDHRIIKSE